MGSDKRLRAIVAGATGYSGQELVRLLLAHPQIELVGAFASRTFEDSPLAAVHPRLTGLTSLPCRKLDEKEIGRLQADVIFLAIPNESALELVPTLLETGAAIVDLSGAFRLQDPRLYPKYYGFEHTRPDLLQQSVYGVTEFAREELKGARLIANPGCYPTSILIPIRPLLDAGVILTDRAIICDSKSGVTGAGKGPSVTTHFAEVSDNFRAYNVFHHRHTPEIAQGLQVPDNPSALIFTAHLLPINRGILSTIYVQLKPGTGRAEVLDIWRETFVHSPFVRVFEDAQLPEIKFVVNSPFVDIGLLVDEESGQAVIISALDNLLKGAASQALQNANLALGLAEGAGVETSF